MLWLLAFGCIENWCDRFNLVCESGPDLADDVVDMDLDVWQPPDDCNDLDATVYPGAPELCDQVDNDCDGDKDEGLGGRWIFVDDDHDGYGDEDSALYSCDATPDGWIEQGGDCNDANPTVHEGAQEVCGGVSAVDEDCDGKIDLEDDSLDPTTLMSGWPDADGDGYGDPTGEAVTFCRPSEMPSGYALANSDCNDSDAEISPGADETCGDGVDNDCDGLSDPVSCNSVQLDDVGWLFISGEASLRAGAEVAAGDIDGDGVADLLVGGLVDGTGGTPARIQVTLGPLTSGGSLGDADLVLTDADSTLSALVSLAGPSDLDDDGWPDLFVAAAGSADGAAWLLSGPISSGSLNELATARLEGESTSSFATSIAATDLDSDGVVDIAVGVPAHSSGGTTYIFTGPLTGTLGTADASATLTEGDSTTTYLGRQLAAVGDTDGDGVADLAVGAPNSSVEATDAGAVYLFCGPLTASLSSGEADATWLGTMAEGTVGSALQPLDDVDGDGLADLAIGAPTATIDLSNQGAIYIVAGSASGTVSIDGAVATILGDGVEGRAGMSLDSPGDVDGDGWPDLVVGSPMLDAQSGAATLLLGPFSGTISLEGGAARWWGSDNGQAATALGSADLDDDGAIDLVLGAPRLDASDGQGVAWVAPGPLY